jgi:hypothetical protein
MINDIDGNSRKRDVIILVVKLAFSALTSYLENRKNKNAK